MNPEDAGKLLGEKNKKEKYSSSAAPSFEYRNRAWK
jgi:hypothetical protein